MQYRGLFRANYASEFETRAILTRSRSVVGWHNKLPSRRYSYTVVLTTRRKAPTESSLDDKGASHSLESERAYNGNSETMPPAIEPVAFMQRVLENFRPNLIFRQHARRPSFVLENDRWILYRDRNIVHNSKTSETSCIIICQLIVLMNW